MNRRTFLKAVGTVGVVMASAGMSLKSLAAGRPLTPEFKPDMATPAELRAAIEALFPAGVVDLRRACDDGEIHRFGMAVTKAEGQSIPYDVGAFKFSTCALGHLKVGSQAQQARLHRAMYAAMYQTWVLIATQPENRGAKLIWRRAPYESHDRTERTVQLRIRAALELQGWRKRFGVDPVIIGGKPEGAVTPMVS